MKTLPKTKLWEPPPRLGDALAAWSALLADNLDSATQKFELSVLDHSFCWDSGGFGAIENGRVFGHHQSALIGSVRRVVSGRFAELVAMVSKEERGPGSAAIEWASGIARTIIRDHFNPSKLLRRVFPSPYGRGTYLPPGLVTPKYESVAAKVIRKKINNAIESELQRAESEAVVRLATSASGPEPKRLKERARRKRTRSPEARKRAEAISDLVSKRLKGIKYCKAMDARGVPIPDRWRREGCPDTYVQANHDEVWQKRIQQEKYRYSRLSPNRARE